jgi:hypothetical protein
MGEKCGFLEGKARKGFFFEKRSKKRLLLGIVAIAGQEPHAICGAVSKARMAAFVAVI